MGEMVREVHVVLGEREGGKGWYQSSVVVFGGLLMCWLLFRGGERGGGFPKGGLFFWHRYLTR